MKVQYLPHYSPPLKEAAGPTITAPLGVPVASAPSRSPTPSCLSLGD